MMMVQAHQLGKRYTDDWVLRGANCEIQARDRIGLVGRNGSGKTTLLNLLTGKETPDEGAVHRQKGLRIGHMEQVFDRYLELSVDEVVDLAFAEAKRWELAMREQEARMADPDIGETMLATALQDYGDAAKRFELSGGYDIEANKQKTCRGLGIDDGMLSRRFVDLSGGEKTKLMLAKVLLEQPTLLLLDEPTNHLDVEAIEWLETFLYGYPGAVLLVSHDRYVLDRLVRQIWDVEDGELTVYPGNYSDFVREKEKRLLLQFEQYEEQQRKIKKMKETIKQLREWANMGNNPRLHQRAGSMEKALERMEKVKKPILDRAAIGLSFEAEDRSGKDVISLEQVSKWYAGACLFSGVDLQVRYRERVAVIGKNGSGKSTLLRLMLGQAAPDGGNVLLGSRVKVGYLSQYGIEADERQTVIAAFREQVPVEEGEARRLLARFLFYGNVVFGKVQDLSGGEKMRLRLAQLMHQQVNLLLLDEPTNHLDIDSREVLEEALRQFDGTVVAISHDRYFLNQIFDKMYWLENGGLRQYLGNYDEAKRKRDEQRAIEEELASRQERSNGQERTTESPKGRLGPQAPEERRRRSGAQSQEGRRGWSGPPGKQEAPEPLERQGRRATARADPGLRKDRVEAEIEEVEKQLSRLDEQLFHPDERDVSRLQSLTEERAHLEKYRDRLYEQLETMMGEM